MAGSSRFTHATSVGVRIVSGFPPVIRTMTGLNEKAAVGPKRVRITVGLLHLSCFLWRYSITVEVSRSHTIRRTRARWDSSERAISSWQRPPPAQHTTNKTGEHPYP